MASVSASSKRSAHKKSRKDGSSAAAAAASAADAAASAAASSAATAAALPTRRPAVVSADPSSTLPSSLASIPRFLHPVHRCRFLSFMPHSVLCLAFSPSGQHLAVGRGNGNIEIWQVGGTVATHSSTTSAGIAASCQGWSLLKVIPGSGEPTVQVLLWVPTTNSKRSSASSHSDRLFSAGLNGRLIEWNLDTLGPKYASDTYGGAVWCGGLSSTPTAVTGEAESAIALGCEDGTIRFFDISDPHSAPLYIRSLSRHSSRVLSLSFSPDQQYLVTGSADSTIKLWELASKEGRNIQRITVEKRSLKKKTAIDKLNEMQTKNDDDTSSNNKNGRSAGTLVWCVVFLSPELVASGDSLGNVQVWELEFGTLRHSFPRALRGDVLALATDVSKDVLYATGTEGKIVEFRRVLGGRVDGVSGGMDEDNAVDMEQEKWLLTAYHRQHTHDVYALAVAPTPLPLPITKQQQLTSPKATSQSAPSSTASSVTSAANNYLLVSGGVDTQLLLAPTSSFNDSRTQFRLLPFMQTRTPVCVVDKVVAYVPATRQEDEDEEGSDEEMVDVSTPTRRVPLPLPPRFLVTHDQHLQLYSLGSFGSFEDTTNKLVRHELKMRETDKLNLEKGYVHLLDINVNSRKSVDTSNPAASIWVPGGGLNLISSAMSPDSRFIACSDPIQVKVYRVEPRRGTNNPRWLNVKKVQVAHLVNPATTMAFSPDSRKLFLGSVGGSVQILDLASLIEGGDENENENEQQLVQTLDEHVPEAVYEGDLSSSDEEDEGEEQPTSTDFARSNRRTKSKVGMLRLLSISADQQYLAVADDFNHLWIYDLDSLRLHATLPTLAQTHLSIAFNPHSSSHQKLAVLCTRNHVYLFDVEARKLTEYSKRYLGGCLVPPGTNTALGKKNVTGASLLMRDQLTHVSFDPTPGVQAMLLHGLNTMLHINLDKAISPDGPSTSYQARMEQHASSSSSSAPAAAAGGSASTLLSRRDRKRKSEESSVDLLHGPRGSGQDLSGDEASSRDPLQVNFRVLTRFKPLIFAGYADESGGRLIPAQPVATTSKTEGKKKRKSAAAAAIDTAAGAGAAGEQTSGSEGERPIRVGSSMIVIEAPWLNILQQLPQPMARHRYGT